MTSGWAAKMARRRSGCGRGSTVGMKDFCAALQFNAAHLPAIKSLKAHGWIVLSGEVRCAKMPDARKDHAARLFS